MADIFYIFNTVSGNTSNITNIVKPAPTLAVSQGAVTSNITFVTLDRGYASVAGVTPRGTWT